jgi:adenine/guanine phosphoribosyltransferase-like PRPP-binding protein
MFDIVPNNVLPFIVGITLATITALMLIVKFICVRRGRHVDPIQNEYERPLLRNEYEEI